MRFELPELDTPSALELLEEARAGIPGLAPWWTDHNPSDPGITLLELFAWLTEMVLYRAGRLRDGHLKAFLKLLGGSQGGHSLDEALRLRVLELREPWLAVTEGDFESLALKHGGLRRVRALGERDLETANTCEACRTSETRTPCKKCITFKPAPSHVSLILVPTPLAVGGEPPAASEELRQDVKEYLAKRRLLTTRLHVVGWKRLEFTLCATLHLAPDLRKAQEQEVEKTAREKLLRWLHPLTGGVNGQGWPFGRAIHGSELYALLERVAGVDSVNTVEFVLPPEMEDLAFVRGNGPPEKTPPDLLLHPAALPALGDGHICLTLEAAQEGGGT
ncbi:hypothetical protein [Corallococcus sp. 4LFB]|uniref:hypothetical protein n=1 Tax=Corallococcus sp. 4LFB TaxID=3383249 RepID=UPI0039771010